MSLVKCKECGKEVSDEIEKCIHCGCPISFGRVIFKTSNTNIGKIGRYSICDEEFNQLAKLKSGEKFVMDIDKDKVFNINRSANIFTKDVQVTAYANQSNEFLIDMGYFGVKVVVKKINK